ncbi:MAG TPA: hypothetical protein H9679_03755, partial [Firmicutes bacterium]|nr:hypothetical protein [Bacillota bacterium]
GFSGIFFKTPLRLFSVRKVLTFSLYHDVIIKNFLSGIAYVLRNSSSPEAAIQTFISQAIKKHG